jgi:FAD/FMN-containing dehydrogenase
MRNVLLAKLAAAGCSGPIITADQPDYDRYRRVWNGLVDRRPAAILRAQTVDDVRRAAEAAAESKALLAVRCGGHSFPGLSTCNDGLVLELSQLNSVSIDRHACTIDVGGGALLGDLDRAATSIGHVVPAGVVSHTGVAGLTLGGGMGWTNRKYGLTIDSLLGAEIVTAGGDVVWTDRDHDPELFWGLRGGGGNFGVVTRFRFKMHPLGPIAVGLWHYPLAQARKAISTLHDLAHEQPRDFAVSFTLAATGLSVAAVWLGAANHTDSMLSPFGALAGSGTGAIENMPFVHLQSRNDEHFSWSRRYYAKGGFWKDVSDQAIDCMVEDIAKAPIPDCELFVAQLGGAIGDVAEDATAYSGRAAGYYWIAEPVWDRPVDDDRCLAWGRASAGRLAALSMAGNYVNEQSDAGPDVARSAYGAEKYSRLVRLKSRMDPHNLFRLNQNIEPAT